MKTIKFKGYELPYVLVDKQADETLLFIHGVASSSTFVDSLIKLDYRFNIIAINLPGSLLMHNEEVDIDKQIEITREFIRRIKTKVTLVGHSLGGAIAAELWDEEKVHRIIYVSSLFPFDKNKLTYKGFKSFFQHEHLYNSVHSIAKKIDEHFVIPKASDEFKKYIISAPLYRHLFINYIFNDERMKTLNKKYHLSLSKETHFMIGEHDKVVDTDEYIHFVENELKQKVWVLDLAGHNPIRNNALQVIDYLNNNIIVNEREANTSLFEED